MLNDLVHEREATERSVSAANGHRTELADRRFFARYVAAKLVIVAVCADPKRPTLGHDYPCGVEPQTRTPRQLAGRCALIQTRIVAKLLPHGGRRPKRQRPLS